MLFVAAGSWQPVARVNSEQELLARISFTTPHLTLPLIIPLSFNPSSFSLLFPFLFNHSRFQIKLAFKFTMKRPSSVDRDIPKKRHSSVERDTPKKRRKPHVPRTSSPLSRHGGLEPLSVQEAKASSELFNQVLGKNKPKAARESSPATHATLESAVSLLDNPPMSSPPELLESVVQKLPPSSGSADMSISDSDDAQTRGGVDKRTAEDEMEDVVAGQDAVLQALKTAVEKKDERNSGARTETVDLETIAEQSPEREGGPAMAKKDDDVEIIQPQRRGSGASAEDAMELDPGPSEQLEREYQLSQQIDSSQDSTADTPSSVVSSRWLLKKLDGLSVDTLEIDRAAIVQELRDMEAEVASLPRANMFPASAGGSPAQRLDMVETLIAPQLAQLPAHVWQGYKAALLRLCAASSSASSSGSGNAVQFLNMDYRQRLLKVKEVVYLPEEIELLHGGDAQRIECAIRVCATVTEITGRDEEIVPEEMAAWVEAELKDMAWKVKVTSAWRKYWPAENGTAAH